MRTLTDSALQVDEIDELFVDSEAPRPLRTEKFRMARWSKLRVRRRSPNQMNGIHRRRRKKIRI